MLTILFLTFTLSAQDGIINGKDDAAFAQELARWGYSDLAEDVATRIIQSSWLSEEERLAGQVLHCSLLQIRGEQATDPQEQSRWYKEAVAGYRNLIPKVYGTNKIRLQLEMADTLVKQVRMILDMQENKLSFESSTSPTENPSNTSTNIPESSLLTQLEEAETLFSAVKQATDKSGLELNPADDTEEEKQRAVMANFRYQAHFGYCRALYFQIKLGKVTQIQPCLKAVDKYIWDYEGTVGGFYAILLRGMIFHEQKDYLKAVSCFDSVIKALANNYLFNFEENEIEIQQGPVSYKLKELFRTQKEIEISSKAKVEVLGTDFIIRDQEDWYWITKEMNSLSVYEILRNDSAIALRIQACYYKAKTLLAAGRYDQVVKTVTDFESNLQQLNQKSLLDDWFGQATMLELAKSYIQQNDHGKALEIAQKIGEKPGIWGMTAKRFLLQWGQDDPNAQQNSKVAYLIAMGLWDKNRYQDAIVSYLKVVQYATSKDDIERYAIDAFDKLGQCFWQLKMYRESGVCYQILSQDYRQYQKITKVTNKNITKEERVSIADKAAYWSYRGYGESFKYSKQTSEQKLSQEMLAYLTQNWPDSIYSLNRIYDQARDKESEADFLPPSPAAINKLIEAEKLYKTVKSNAEQYELALVYAGKCYFKAAEVQIQIDNPKQETIPNATSDKAPDDNSKPATTALVVKITDKAKAYLQLATDELSAYQKYTEANTILSVDTQRLARRQEAVSLALYYQGRIALLLADYEKAVSHFNRIRQQYSDQIDMFTSATYFLIKLNIEQNKLENAEQLLADLEKKAGENPDPLTLVGKYQSHVNYLLGMAYNKKMEELKPTPPSSNNQEQSNQWNTRWLEYAIKSANYLNRWIEIKPPQTSAQKKESPASTYEWLAGKFIMIAQKYSEQDKPATAKIYYQKAIPLLQKSLKILQHEGSKLQSQYIKQEPESHSEISSLLQDNKNKQEATQIRLVRCAMMMQDCQLAVQLMYPTYRLDRDRRERQRKQESGPLGKDKATTQQQDANYLDLISEILMKLGEQESFQNERELYIFLLQYSRYDFLDDFNNFRESNSSAASIYDKYLNFIKLSCWLSEETLSTATQKALNDTWQKDRREYTGLKELQLIGIYDTKYRNAIDTEFPLAPEQSGKLTQLSPSAYKERIKRLSIYLADMFTTQLVEKLPQYQDMRAPFGAYDNPQWWEAKYRQVYITYLRGEPKLARGAIEILRIQQKAMGGPKYEQKFNDLYTKLKDK